MSRLAAIVATAAVTIAAAAPALAQTPKLTPVESAAFPDRAWVLELPQKSQVAAESIEITENGRAVSDLQLSAGSASGAKTFGTVLAIDASESMRGAAIENAMAAARTFAGKRRPDQPLGLLLFSRDSRVVLPLTTDSRKIDQALAQVPQLTKGTRIFDAAGDAISMLERARIASGSVVVLSDGGDVGSRSSAADVREQARRGRARIFSVGLTSPSFDSRALREIAQASGGVYSQARSREQLDAVYAELGERLSNEYLLTYRSVAQAGEAVDLQVRVAGFEAPATARYSAPQLAIPTPAAQAAAEPSDVPMYIVIALVAALLALAVWLIVRGPRASVTDRVAQYIGPDRGQIFQPPVAEEPRTPLFSRVGSGIARRIRWWPRFTERVELADLGVRPGQLALGTAVFTIVVVWALFAIDRPVTAVVAAAIPLGLRAIISSRIARKRQQFSDQLADNLQVVASAMRAGHSFEGGLSVAATDAAEPMRSELTRVVNDERLGMPVGEAMSNVARRMASPEFDQVATIVMAQREAGGNIAELLDHAVESLRFRADLRRTVRSLTSQGRFGGTVVTLLPIAMVVFMSTITPGFYDAMLAESVGRLLLIISGGLVVAGWLVIRKLVDIQV